MSTAKMYLMFGWDMTCADPDEEQVVRTPPPPPQPYISQKYRVSWQYWSGSPEKSQSYQASIQCWAIIGTPAKHHLNRVSLAGR